MPIRGAGNRTPLPAFRLVRRQGGVPFRLSRKWLRHGESLRKEKHCVSGGQRSRSFVKAVLVPEKRCASPTPGGHLQRGRSPRCPQERGEGVAQAARRSSGRWRCG